MAAHHVAVYTKWVWGCQGSSCEGTGALLCPDGVHLLACVWTGAVTFTYEQLKVSRILTFQVVLTMYTI